MGCKIDISCTVPLISVIMPVFNSEDFLERALSSVATQTFSNFELIIINDGSTDKSLDIINSFVSKYKNFRLINNKNIGASKSRNIGINEAKGKYIAFLDSDDFMDKNFLEVLYNKLLEDNSDIVCCNYYLYSQKTSSKSRDIFMIKSGKYGSKKLLGLLIKDFRMHHYIWNKLFKRSLFLDNNLKFKDMCFEDIEIMPKLFYFADKISVVNKALYYYVRHKDSMVSRLDIRKFNDYMRSLLYLRNFLESKGIYDEYRLSFLFYSLRIMITNFKLIYFIHRDKGSLRGFFRDLGKAISKVSFCISGRFKCFKSDYIPKDTIN